MIEVEYENLFWEKGLLGISIQNVLQCTVIFYIGLNFVLRGIQEQYNVVPFQCVCCLQDTRIYESVYYEYREYISKNNQHWLKDIKPKNVTVKAIALPENDHCIVKLLDKYLSLLPSDASYFYMWSKDKVPPIQSVSSFAKQWVGINILKTYHQSYHKNLVRHTNHSLQATVIMGMFNGQVEKSHCWDFRHKSLKALRRLSTHAKKSCRMLVEHSMKHVTQIALVLAVRILSVHFQKLYRQGANHKNRM